MPDPLGALIASATGWLATYLLHSTVLLVAARPVAKMGRLGPRSRAEVWRVAMIGGLITSSVAFALSNPPRLEQVRIERMGIAAAPEPSSAVAALPVDVQPRPRVLHLEAVVAVVPAGRVPWSSLLVLAWLVGAAALGARVALQAVAARRLRAAAAPASLRARACLERLQRDAAGSPRARVRSSRQITGPCVVPGGVILLPADRERDFSDAELRAVLAHELTHVRRRDAGWSTALRALAAVLWVQPLNRMAVSAWTAAVELACDDGALERTGEREGLASSIERVAAWTLAGSVASPGLAMAGRCRGTLTDRVRRIVDARPAERDPAWLLPSLALGLTVTALSLPSVPLAPRSSFGVVVVERRLEAWDASTGTRPPGDAPHLLARDVEVVRVLRPD